MTAGAQLATESAQQAAPIVSCGQSAANEEDGATAPASNMTIKRAKSFITHLFVARRVLVTVEIAGILYITPSAHRTFMYPNQDASAHHGSYGEVAVTEVAVTGAITPKTRRPELVSESISRHSP